MNTQRSTSGPPVVTALVVDDEPLARRKVRELLREVSWIECIGEAADGLSAVRLIDELRPDLAFLDIRMPGLSGLEILKRVRRAPAVIFTTAYDRYAVTAFERSGGGLPAEAVQPRPVSAVDRARAASAGAAGGRGHVRRAERCCGRRRCAASSSARGTHPADPHGRRRAPGGERRLPVVYAAGRRYRINAPLAEPSSGSIRDLRAHPPIAHRQPRLRRGVDALRRLTLRGAPARRHSPDRQPQAIAHAARLTR